MYHDVVETKYLGEYKIKLKFDNGKKGVVDFKQYIKKKGLFKRFVNINYFRKFYIDKEIGVLCWPGGLDIAPETIYSETTGEPLPDWMEVEENTKMKKLFIVIISIPIACFTFNNTVSPVIIYFAFPSKAQDNMGLSFLSRIFF